MITEVVEEHGYALPDVLKRVRSAVYAEIGAQEDPGAFTVEHSESSIGDSMTLTVRGPQDQTWQAELRQKSDSRNRPAVEVGFEIPGVRPEKRLYSTSMTPREHQEAQRMVSMAMFIFTADIAGVGETLPTE